MNIGKRFKAGGEKRTLFNFPLLEPALVERDADVDAEHIIGDECLRLLAHPLETDVHDGAVVLVPHVDNRYSQTYACAILLGAVLTVDFQVGRGIGDTEAIADSVDIAARAVLVGAILGTQGHLLKVGEVVFREVYWLFSERIKSVHYGCRSIQQGQIQQRRCIDQVFGAVSLCKGS